MEFLGFRVGDIISRACATASTATATATATVILQARSAWGVSCNVYDPIVVVHCVLLACGREVRACGEVEYLCLSVTDEVFRCAR